MLNGSTIIEKITNSNGTAIDSAYQEVHYIAIGTWK